ncbi:unnamed protein product [Phytophthora fragariaefolia]|uniref:Unnamed protein product n=1 Tax=Phytophthora fragariaefolia TaxID=1490495 RepID=A0A9W6TX13_9STRA|nr:unnamed protein product [Phytophthora fragariaefolia]
MRAEVQSVAQASATNTAALAARPTTTKPVKMSVPTFDGKDSVDSTCGWLLFRMQPTWSLSSELPHQPVEGATRQEAQGASGSQQPRGDGGEKQQLPLGAGRPAGRLCSSSMKVRFSPASPKEQVPGTPLLCLSVAAARSNLMAVTASVKGYPEPMTVLIDSGASFIFATKASVVTNNALYASALEASKIIINVSVRLATGSIVSKRKVTIPLIVKLDDFNSVERFVVLEMDDRYDIILGMFWLAKHEPWIDWRSRTIGASHNPLADRALAGHAPFTSRDGFVHEHRDGEDPQDPNTSPLGRHGSAGSNRVAFVQGAVKTQGADAAAARAGLGGSVRAPPTYSVAAGLAHVEKCAGVVARANESGRVGTPTTQGVVIGSARATEGAGACARATTGGRARAPTSKAIRDGKVTSTPNVEASSGDVDYAAGDRVPQVFVVFTGEPKVGEVLTPLPTVVELLELEELSYVEVLDSLKAGELAEVVLPRPEGNSLELNSSSVMDSEVLEDERTSRR